MPSQQELSRARKGMVVLAVIALAVSACGQSRLVARGGGQLAARFVDDFAAIAGRKPPMVLPSSTFDDLARITGRTSDEAVALVSTVSAGAPAESRAAATIRQLRESLSSSDAEVASFIACATWDAMKDGRLTAGDAVGFAVDLAAEQAALTPAAKLRMQQTVSAMVDASNPNDPDPAGFVFVDMYCLFS